jgi:hypothetical protein
MESPARQEPSAAKAAADSMVDRGMLWMDNDGVVQWQGHVIAALGGEYYLIQLISMPIGDQISCPIADPTDQIVVHISSFAVASPDSKGKPMFYDSLGDMREAYNCRFSPNTVQQHFI